MSVGMKDWWVNVRRYVSRHYLRLAVIVVEISFRRLGKGWTYKVRCISLNFRAHSSQLSRVKGVFSLRCPQSPKPCCTTLLGLSGLQSVSNLFELTISRSYSVPFLPVLLAL